jgi:cytochrome c oxidase accessory protein FixG
MQKEEAFRDSIGTIDAKGKRKWIYPKRPKGKFTNYRTYVSVFLLLLLFLGPHLKKNGDPLFLFNLMERKFIVFGTIFWPQDFYLFGLAMVTLVVFVILFTVVYGRIFCGWVCPQTIFMEMVFRKIEYWIEGDNKRQKLLNSQPWSPRKIAKKLLKHGVFFLISFTIANTFLAYIIGADRLFQLQTGPLSEGLGTLSTLLIFTIIFYFVFSWFREQVCIVACPYGRLQGVMLDRHSIVVAYDYIRGEVRGKFKKNENRSSVNKGDCIDCGHCVDVCPTGIDIRNGTQLECVNCTACIDACDFMMEKVNLPKGLIRLESEAGITNSSAKKTTSRMIAYTIVLGLLIVVMGYLLSGRSAIDVTVLRTPGMLYQHRENQRVSNLYNWKVRNKTNRDMRLEFRLLTATGTLEMIGNDTVLLLASSSAEGAFFLLLDRKHLTGLKTKREIGVFSEGQLLEKIHTNFLGPITLNNH